MDDDQGAVLTVLKIVVAGGFGVGKTTLIGAVSETAPLQTEELITSASTGTDSLVGVERKDTTTVFMDFGRITFDAPPVKLMLFGTPGQNRFQFAWEDLALGAMGAIVLADTRRLTDSFDALAHFESFGVPFVVAVNEFDTAQHRYTTDEVRQALELPTEVPVLLCDARDETSAATVLLALVEYAADHAATPRESTLLGAHS